MLYCVLMPCRGLEDDSEPGRPPDHLVMAAHRKLGEKERRQPTGLTQLPGWWDHGQPQSTNQGCRHPPSTPTGPTGLAPQELWQSSLCPVNRQQEGGSP